MLTISNNGEQIPLNFDDYYIQEVYGGKDAAGFTLPLDHPDYQYLFEETPLIDTETKQRYLIKAIDEGQTTVNIKAELDLDELSRDMFLNYTNGSDTVVNTISKALPDGWAVQDHAYFNQRRTIELEAATPLDVIDACPDIYNVVFRFDNNARVIHIYNPDSEEISGVFLTDELNLKSVNFKGKSSGFATRLYAKGKDSLTFADINGGKDYVEDFSYSDKVISVYWKDERYTIAENLLADAKKRLKSMAVPQQSYTCGVMDLARARENQEGKNDNIYSFLEFKLYQNVVLLDRRRNRRITHTVAGIKRYPKYPEKNEVTLSTVAPSIQNSVKSIQTQMEKPTSTFNQIRQAGLETAGEMITGQLGGNYIVTMNPETQKPNGWAIMDTDNTETAMNVWRATLGGIGHSSNGFNGTPNIAFTMDGKINASMILTGELWANLIKTGKIQSHTGAVYFDLDANNGKGELASSVLKGVDDGVTTTAKIGSGSWAGGEPYQGFRISYPGGNSGLLLITIDGISEDFPLANKDEIVSNGDLIIRSNGISEYSGGASGLYLNGNSSTGEGTVIVKRGTKGKTNKNIFYADPEQLLVQYDGYNNYLRFSNAGCVLYDKNKIEFGTNGYMRASIESNGDAKFGNIYSNGSLVTSDRKKKTGVKKLSGTFLEKVRGSAVYRYRLKQDMIPEGNAKNLKRKSVGTKNESVGLMYDEAPEEIRRETESGDKAIDLYGMVSVLWKAVQELSDKVDSLQQKQEV
ncbi:MAG: phage tail spike protein [[Clostridium] leptum]